MTDVLHRVGAARAPVHRYLGEQVAALRELDPAVRRDEPGAVHETRIATRRLRSALSTFRPLFDRGTTDHLRDELKWLARVLGEVRDAEVMRERLALGIEVQPPEDVVGTIEEQVDRELTTARQVAQSKAVLEMDSDRYQALVAACAEVEAAPPWTPYAEEPGAEVLRKRIRKDWKRLRAAAREAGRADNPADRDRVLHETRKAAKRLRYSCEVVEPEVGKPAKELRQAARQIQSVLGERQDSVVTQEFLRALAIRLHGQGHNPFTLGRLQVQEEEAAERLEAEFAEVWRAASKKGLRAWLKA